MVQFRKLRLGDLDSIYQDKELRPMITVQPKGQKFGVVIEEEGEILGGASGYAYDNAAFLQCAAVKDMEQSNLYKDGLIRSLIHFLELDGADYLFIREDDPIYRQIGFVEFRAGEGIDEQLSETASEDIQQEPVILYINLKKFFRNHKC